LLNAIVTTGLEELEPIDENSKGIPLKFGETYKFDRIGPVILNDDCTMRRIDNWDEMTEREQEVTWKRIAARNAKRKEQCAQREADGTLLQKGEEERVEIELEPVVELHSEDGSLDAHMEALLSQEEL